MAFWLWFGFLAYGLALLFSGVGFQCRVVGLGHYRDGNNAFCISGLVRVGGGGVGGGGIQRTRDQPEIQVGVWFFIVCLCVFVLCAC